MPVQVPGAGIGAGTGAMGTGTVVDIDAPVVAGTASANASVSVAAGAMAPPSGGERGEDVHPTSEPSTTTSNHVTAMEGVTTSSSSLAPAEPDLAPDLAAAPAPASAPAPAVASQLAALRTVGQFQGGSSLGALGTQPHSAGRSVIMGVDDPR